MFKPAEKYTQNQMLLLSLLRSRGCATRAELAEISGLSALTVTKTAAGFLSDGVAREEGFEASTGGRKAAVIGLNGDFGYALAVDIGAYSVKIGVVNLSGEVLDRQFLYSEKPGTIPSFIVSPEILSERLSALIRSRGQSRCLGVGFGISGIVNAERNKVLFCPNVAGWDGFDIPRYFGEKLGVPVFLDTSARCMALGEQYYGRARGEKNFIFVSAGYSVAAGIVVGGKIFRGGNGSAGELGHTLVRDSGILCTCGNRDCLELFVTVPMVLMKVERLVGKADVDTVRKAVENGKPGVAEALAETGRTLGVALANMSNLLNPDMIILGGGLIDAFPVVKEEAERSVKERCLVFAGERLDVETSALGSNGAVVGCASQALNDFFGV